MNRVVRETRQRVRDDSDFNFGLVRVAELENLLGNAPHLRVGK